jgi:hypothetical protein
LRPIGKKIAHLAQSEVESQPVTQETADERPFLLAVT